VLAITTVGLGVRGWSGPLAALAAGVAIAVVARPGRRLLLYLAAALPIVASVLLLDAVLYPGATDTVAVVGPLAVTGSGLAAGIQAALRVVGLALAVGVLALTTPLDDLLDDLEARGLGRRSTFVVGSALRTVPRMLERGREIADAQRARGLDTDGPPWRRARGIVAVGGPMVVAALVESDERAVALEARGFGAPGRRATLRPFPDTTAQRAQRWGSLLLALALVAASVTGRLALP
jgi:energy-coupling factor transport system permease protein